MITSMTGFGRSEGNLKGVSVTVEGRSVNNRFLDISVKLPRRLMSFEEPLTKIVKENFSRGKVEFTVIMDGFNESLQVLEVNEGAVKQYSKAFKKLEKSFGGDFKIDAEHLLKYDDIFVWQVPEEKLEQLKKFVVKIFEKAAKDLIKHKKDEGKNLEKDFRMRLSSIEKITKDVRKLVEERHLQDYANLKARLLKIFTDVDKIDPDRMAIEAAYMSEKFDIAEECVRLDSHIKLFRHSLNQGGVIGRKLDFILQEMYREANTIGSKSNNLKISGEVVGIKEEIDKLKEQVRNVE